MVPGFLLLKRTPVMRCLVPIIHLTVVLLIQGSGAQLQVQLVNGTSYWNGRLEILHNGTWTTVCSNYFGKEEAQVACKMLGLDSSRAMAVGSGQYGEGSGLILFGNVTCTGKESSFDECQHDGFYRRDCRHNDDVGIICNIKPLRLRLTSVFGDRSDINRVEMELGTQWNSLCMTRNAAKVVCRQLGLSQHAALYRNVSMQKDILSEKNKHSELDIKFLCLGNETSLLECDRYGPNKDVVCGLYNSVNCNESIPPLRILYNEASFPLLDGANLTLECEITQSGELEFTYLWFEYSRIRLQSQYGKYLIFNNVTKDHHELRVYCGANYWYNGLHYLVASDVMIITVCCTPSTIMHNTEPTSVYIRDDKGYLTIEMTAYPIPQVTATMYLGPVLTDGVKGEDTSNTTRVICADVGLARASVSCNITVFNISQAADGFYKIVFDNKLGQLPYIFTIRRQERRGEIPSAFLLTFVGAFVVGIVIFASVTVYCVRRWTGKLIRLVV
ncbi:uncharacterized protein LOC112569305 isoform X2 [Pomacea canaliculata]|uniref:uncharacterized protein LOC112569305 isoform X2 n=1 Tax=Pomacea canaliculata TaxID=400727 RepID=UPI000D73C51E|nr:uncharacterized protein LOC112569305 isoform X2 [Pomacea canaliculata]